MNERQPYEKHLADKLQELSPAGEASQYWPQMKALLDRDLPEGGGGGRRGGPPRWWMYGIIAGLLLIGTWFFTTGRPDKAPSTAAAAGNIAESKKETAASSGVSLTPGVDKLGTDTEDKSKGTVHQAGENSPATDNATAVKPSREAQKIQTPSTLTDKDNSTHEDDATVKAIAVKNNETRESGIDERAAPSSAGKESVAKANSNTHSNKARTTNTRVITKSEVNNPRSILNERGATAPATVAGSRKNKAGKNTSGKTTDVPDAANYTFSEIDYLNAAAVRPIAYEALYGAVATQEIVKGDLKTNYSTALLPTYVHNAPTRFKSETERVRRLRHRSVGTGENKNLVFGLSMPMSVPLSDQQVVSYNVAGKANTALDYLPGPHMQYHINQKSFVQAELQIANPQFIQPVLVSQNKYELGPTNPYRYVTNSTFARKLYYFNVPIGIHYSPFKNFYMGSGIQFSSMLSGIAQYESRAYNSMNIDTLLRQTYSKFRNDTISDKFNNNEFRVMIDANYYWKRFTVGLRYNQALSNYISIQVNSTTPYFADKNKSMLFYLRYNLWENKKK